MPTELDSRNLDAVLRANKIRRHAELLQQARRTWPWQLVLFLVMWSVAFFWLDWRSSWTNSSVFTAILLSYFVSVGFYTVASRRMDAIVKLLEDEEARKKEDTA